MKAETGRGTWSSVVRLACAGAIAFAALAVSSEALAADPSGAVNACGCRKDESSGACYCDRKAKCGCPGECEPKGCEEKRAKQLEKEVEMETKKAEEAARKHHPAETDDDRAPPSPRHAEPEETAPKKHAEHHMSAADRRTLQRLLNQYVSDHPEAGQQSIDQVRAVLGEGGGKR